MSPDVAAALAEELNRLRAERARIDVEIKRYEKALAAIRGLTGRERSVTTNGMSTMEVASRLAHSRARSSDPLVLAAIEHRLTLQALAGKVGCTASLLTQARRGGRTISPKVARKIEGLIGFAATRENWPGLRTE